MGNTIHVYDLDWKTDSASKQMFDLTKQESRIEKIVWHSNDGYLFVKNSDENLKFVEIDNSLPINEVLISTGVIDFSYDYKGGALYYGNDTGVWKLEI